ncbi:MAG: recombination protein NinB [Thauera sp.]|nr:recombination protein NinB [Thauera sp.]
MIRLTSPAARQAAMRQISQAPEGYVCIVKEATRSLEQNARLWAMLTDVSNQVDWYGQTLTPEEWKDVLTAAMKKQKVVPGIDGGFVVVGARTSKMGVREMGELMELIEAFGAQQGVRFSAREAA